MLAITLLYCGIAAQLPTIAELENTVFKYLDKLESFSATFEIDGTWLTGRQFPLGQKFFGESVTVSKNGNSWRVEKHTKHSLMHKGKLRIQTECGVHVSDPDIVTSARLQAGSRKHDGSTVTIEKNLDQRHSPYLSPFFSPIICATATSSNVPYRKLLFNQGARISRDVVNQVQAICVFNETPQGTYSIWLDEKRGYSPLKFTESLTKDQFYFGKDTPTKDQIPFEKIEYSLVVLQSTSVDGFIVPIEWECRSLKKISGEEDSNSMLVRMKNLKVNPVLPPSTFSLAGLIADGTPVKDFRDPHVAFVWKDGGPKKTYSDEFAAAEFDFRNSGFTFYWWLAILVAIGIAILVFRLTKKQRAAS